MNQVVQYAVVGIPSDSHVATPCVLVLLLSFIFISEMIKTRLRADLLGVIGTAQIRLWCVLVFMKTRPMAGWAGLGCSTHKFM